MPMFAVTGCDYGNQTLADPAPGHIATGVPMLYKDADDNTIRLTADTQVLTDSAGADVDSLVKDSTGNIVRFTATGWSKRPRSGSSEATTPSVPPIYQAPLNNFWPTGMSPRRT